MTYDGEIINVPEGTTANPPPSPKDRAEAIAAARDRELAELTATAKSFVGLTITSAQALAHELVWDGNDVLRLTFTDGSSARISADYGGYLDIQLQPGPHEDPHSRACGIRRHDHGTDCSQDCPTCYAQRGGTP